MLAIAALGLVMVAAFKNRLLNSLGSLDIPSSIVADVQNNAIKLAGIELPAGLYARRLW